MPEYRVRDPRTGRTVVLRGTSPPTEAELTDIFAKLPPAAQVPQGALLGGVESTVSGAEMSDADRLKARGAANRSHWQREIEEWKEFSRRITPPVPGAGMPSLLKGGGGMAQKVVTAGKSVAANAAPAVKYEVVKSGMEAVGLPPSVATTVAMLVSGTSRGGTPKAPPRPRASRAKASAPAAPPSAPTASAAGSIPATPAPPVAPSASPTAASPTAAPGSPRPHPEGGVWSPQRIQNELGLTARRTGAKLSEQEYQQAGALVAQGKTPADAILQTVGARAKTAAAAPAKLKLSAAEGKVYLQLRQKGKTHAEATEAIESQRALAEKLGTPSNTQVGLEVAIRNATGRWKKP